ncbi:laminin subunit alpha-1 [Schistocerca cancellata]|uniref:laminin subunit alpha-1 n=1 Tax=Schistocerca cancellata TaxID=274614 RepID=UPI0021195320|nr:laminin subunit alpha-1 [Schistocerca cancellata]
MATMSAASGSKPQCECRHNTCGASCERCCPLHNQQPWRAGTARDAAACQPCQCFGHASSCRYDRAVALARRSLDTGGRYSGGGVCVNCSAHTTGNNCEQCVDGWYRPSGVSPDNPNPCVPCDCNSSGATGNCAKDDTNGKVAGACECKPGYSGYHCDRCDIWYRGFPQCTPCLCDPRGSIAGACEKECICKKNVDGQQCDHCKPGFFGLDENNPDGCNECYCSGVSTICEKATLYYDYVSSLSGWLVSDFLVSRTVVPSVEKMTMNLYVGNYDLSGVDMYYWLAPKAYSNSILTSYGNNITFEISWVVMRGDTSGQPIAGPLLILMGNNGLKIGYGYEEFYETNVTISIPLHENGWYLIPEELKDIKAHTAPTEYQGADVTRYQFMSVLSDLKHLMLRAKYNTDQQKGRLKAVSLKTGLPSADGAVARQVERCLCPPGYTGLSCENCQYGYAKIGSTLPYDEFGYECRKCNCNGHAATCNPVTGECLACEHNTTGGHCEICADGYYGNPEQGTPADCQPCACPLLQPSNNFSPTCEAHGRDDYVCTSCPIGYAGKHCEMCASDYFGNPLEIGSTCQPCNCNGGPCDSYTGQCLECKGNTEGWRCDKCLPAHYGDPMRADCHPCDCSEEGSLQTDRCDAVTGQCECREKFSGQRCDRCQEGLGNVTAGCIPCNCHPIGSKLPACNPFTGECMCHNGIQGPYCDTCAELHYNFSSSGCIGCGCHSVGATSAVCDIVTGQCPCRPHTTGRACDRCQDGYWGLSATTPCEPCGCDRIGSINTSCDQVTGQCHCKSGIGGRICDTCLPHYYGFSVSGCSRCESCSNVGHICDPDTGRCVCPPFTEGNLCERCQPNAWGFVLGRGCKACNCDVAGSLQQRCDSTSGRCMCRRGFHGDRCSSCAVGYYGYPVCRLCDCHLPGTQQDKCDTKTGQCLCDESGQCPCKANVVGKKCNECKEGTFGLQADNPDGCTQCFCFGRTTACTQAGLTWSQIMMPRSRTLEVMYTTDPPQFKGMPSVFPFESQDINYIQVQIPGKNILFNTSGGNLNVTNSLLIIPGEAGDVKIGSSYLFGTPLYWQLPKQFLGDKILSYGGYLRFTIQSENSNRIFPVKTVPSYPLVQLQGNGRIILEYYPVASNPHGHYEIRFHESLWRQKGKLGEKVTREILMIALQNIQHILIRATDSLDFSKVVLRDVTLDTAVAVPGQPPPLAKGVELCACPPEYNSTSCQDPSIGFYRWYDNNQITSTIIIKLVGEARPCQCNNRSSICDIETGYCLNCSENTSGPHCDRCAEGFYGDPERGSCLPCPCPHPVPGGNFAVRCRVTPGHVHCHCRPGYTGKRCERCSYGWYGFPLSKGGSCVPCNCNKYGSVSDECDEETGQCNCRTDITGRDCSLCQERRNILTQRGCMSCDDKCTGVLLDELENLSFILSTNTEHLSAGFVPPPWTALRTIQNNSDSLKQELDEWITVIEKVRSLPAGFGEELRKKAKALMNRVKKLERNSKHAVESAVDVRTEATAIQKEILQQRTESKDIIKKLQNFGKDGTAVNIDLALQESHILLDKIRKNDLGKRGQNALNILRGCEKLLKNIKNLIQSAPSTQKLKQKLNSFHEKLNDLNAILQNMTHTLNKVENINHQNNRKLKETDNDLQEILKWEDDINILSDTNKFLISNASLFLDEASRRASILRNTQRELSNLTERLQETENKLSRLNPAYRDKYVIPAQEHAHKLYERVKNMRRMLNATLEDASFALRASNAYRDIVTALKRAEEAAVNATIAADAAYGKVYPGILEDSLLEQSNIAKADSTRLISRASQQLKRVGELQRKFDDENKAVDLLRETVRSAAEEDNAISRELQKFNTDKVAVSVNNTVEKLGKVMKTVNGAQSKAEKVAFKVRSELRPQLEQIDTDLQLSKIEENISQTRSTVKQADDVLLKLTEEANQKRRKFQQWNDTFAEKLQRLRDSITKARHAADGIRLSITSNANNGCVRSYKPKTLVPTITTSIILNYAVDSDEKDALLFYLSSSNSSSKDFIALEMVNRKIRFLWDVGGGVGIITHPRKIETAVLKEDKNWYRIEVERTSNIAKLAVRHQVLPDGSPEYSGDPQTNSTAPGFGRLDVGPDDVVWIGGLPPYIPVPPQLLSARKKFVGCLHRVVLDGRPIGLWNFNSEIKGSCTACIEGVEESRDEQSYRFTGDGYAIRDATLYDKYAFSISLKIRTLDENALIFMAVNKNKDQFVAVVMREGKVIFIILYGDGNRLEISTSNFYNTGKWFHIDAIRFFDRRSNHETAKLKIGNDEHEASPISPQSSDTIPDLSEAYYLIGGLPPGCDLAQNNIGFTKPFLGCMSGIQVVNEGINPLQGKFYGVEASCSLSLRVVSFEGNGYLELPSHTLKRKSSFEFVFRSLQNDALLMLTTSAKTDSLDEERTEKSHNVSHYYSVSLKNGRIIVWLDAGFGKAVLTSATSFNDGQFHVVSVIKQSRKLELRVDDAWQSTAVLPGSAVVIKAPGKTGGLYFGGVPQDINWHSMAASANPMVGTIKDANFNNELLQFDDPVSFKHAAIGRSSRSIPDRNNIQFIPQGSIWHKMNKCQVASYSVEQGAVKFGDSHQSHIKMDLGVRSILQKNFALEFDFRTFYPNGLLFFIPDSRRKQRHYIVGTLFNKKMKVVIKKGKRQNKIVTHSDLNDGLWHHVSLQREKQNLRLFIDTIRNGTMKYPKKLNIRNIMYFGALPEAGLQFASADEEVKRYETFKGCIRHLTINGQTEDLVGPKATHHKVGQCFPRVEAGSYFSGDAYAIYKENFEIVDPLELELEFRTSEITGVLLSAATPNNSPAFSLELNSGKVIMKVDMGDRKPFRVEQEFPSQYTICDNKWHRITAFFTKDELALKVDQLPNKYGLSGNGSFIKASVGIPLYIGGLPDNGSGTILETRDSFKGCIRNVKIGNIRRDWTDMASLHNILLNSCPISS